MLVRNKLNTLVDIIVQLHTFIFFLKNMMVTNYQLTVIRRGVLLLEYIMGLAIAH
jgi:hypothetical protein